MEDKDFKYEYVMGRTFNDDHMFPVIVGYIFTHQFTVGEYFITFENVLNIFKSIIEKNDKLYWNSDKNEIILRLYLPVNNDVVNTIKIIMNNISNNSIINVDGHYVMIKINELLKINKDEYYN